MMKIWRHIEYDFVNDQYPLSFDLSGGWVEPEIEAATSPGPDYVEYSPYTLDEYKAIKETEIDARTGELIAMGYEFPPASGMVFSLSQNAQINILALDNSRNDPAMAYPINYNTIDNTAVYAIPDAATVHNMYLTALATKKAHLDSGTALKDLVRAAVDKAGVDAVIDNR